MACPRGDRGQAVVVMLAVVAVGVVVVLAVASLGVRLVERSRARVAADAAALAAVVDGRAGAEALARRNGATVVGYHEQGDEVTVTVEVAGERATARATDAP